MKSILKVEWTNHLNRPKKSKRTPLEEKFAPHPTKIPLLESKPLTYNDSTLLELFLKETASDEISSDAQERCVEAICDTSNFMIRGFKFRYFTSQDNTVSKFGLAILTFSYSDIVGGLCVHLEGRACSEPNFTTFEPLLFQWLHASYPNARRFSFTVEPDCEEHKFSRYGYHEADDKIMVLDVTL